MCFSFYVKVFNKLFTEASKLVQQILRFLLESNYGECLKQCLRVKNIFESIMTLKSLSTFQFNSSENYLQDLPVLERYDF